MNVKIDVLKDNPSSPRKTLKMCKVKLLVESFLRRSNICGFETNNYDTKNYSIYQRSRARWRGQWVGDQELVICIWEIFFFFRLMPSFKMVNICL